MVGRAACKPRKQIFTLQPSASTSWRPGQRAVAAADSLHAPRPCAPQMPSPQMPRYARTRVLSMRLDREEPRAALASSYSLSYWCCGGRKMQSGGGCWSRCMPSVSLQASCCRPCFVRHTSLRYARPNKSRRPQQHQPHTHPPTIACSPSKSSPVCCSYVCSRRCSRRATIWLSDDSPAEGLDSLR